MRVCGVYFVFVILLSACTNGVSHLDIALQQAKHIIKRSWKKC